MLAFKVLISTVIYFHLTWNIVCVYIFVYLLLFLMSNRTMATVWHRKSVKELESYLKERCVSVSNSRKASLVQLCAAAAELDIEVDPDGLVEDRAEVIQQKLTLDVQQLTNPSILREFTNDLSNVPRISIIDMYSYLTTS